jgi:acetyl esterase/lipase
VLDDEQKSSIAAIGESAGASLSVAYGEPERIRLIANTPGNFPLTDLSGMLGLTSIVQAISIISGEGMPDIGALEAMVDGQGEAQ